MTNVENLPFPPIGAKWKPYRLTDDLLLDGKYLVPKDVTIQIYQTTNFGWICIPKMPNIPKRIFKV